jgi:hypothetical protein
MSAGTAARVERSETRELHRHTRTPIPDFAALNPGYTDAPQ